MSLTPVIHGGYDENGNWQRYKICFVSCGNRCTCMPPDGKFYNAEYDKRVSPMKKAAEILVECGYAERFFKNCMGSYTLVEPAGYEYQEHQSVGQICDPFLLIPEPHNPLEHECHARRQADAIEDWFEGLFLSDVERDLDRYIIWNVSSSEVACSGTNHQWRLDRIKWCLEQLEATPRTP